MEALIQLLAAQSVEITSDELEAKVKEYGFDPATLTDGDRSLIVNDIVAKQNGSLAKATPQASGGKPATSKGGGKPARQKKTTTPEEDINAQAKNQKVSGSVDRTKAAREGMLVGATNFKEKFTDDLSDDVISILDEIPGLAAEKIVLKSASRAGDAEAFQTATTNLLQALYDYQ